MQIVTSESYPTDVDLCYGHLLKIIRLHYGIDIEKPEGDRKYNEKKHGSGSLRVFHHIPRHLDYPGGSRNPNRILNISGVILVP